jgi:hypothetical protein
MRFSEAVENKVLKSRIVDLLEYTYGWEEFNPVIPSGADTEIKSIIKDVFKLLEQVDEKMQELGKINKDSFEY